ncbi:hypothetical protein BGZ83_009827 [Gryganskiella cystojenkinii]|nr:hypothetical protein BGZ83_009827 [Gryganskiella cystojenkinii]
MVNDRTQSAMMKKSNRAEEWLKNSVRDKHVRLIPFSEISKVKYNVAKGGSGTIHLGAWRNMHVAIKEQHNTNDLIKELKMHKQVHDSNYIVKFYGITKHPLTHDTCIVMQFAENGCLQDYLETQNVSITWLTKYRLAWEIASGLDFIHRENIFHTDLHSRNILIDTAGKALITDFGLSKSVNKTIYTTKAGLFGVVPYVAPERMQNPTITYTAKCDIYSLGVILWELSSCVIPFEAQLQDVMLAVNIIAGVREKTVPGTAVEYEMLYRRCWDGLPQLRPQMEIVLSELVELLASEQINPRPAAPRPRSPKPTRPLSSDSMVAPGVSFPYENDSAMQSSPENTNHVRPASPPSILRPGARQSFAGLAPLAQQVQQGTPPMPIRQDRSGNRVSVLGEPIVKDNVSNGHPKANGTLQPEAGRNGQAKQAQHSSKSNGRLSPANTPSNLVNNSNNNNNNNNRAPTVNGHDVPTIHDNIPNGSIKPNESRVDAEKDNDRVAATTSATSSTTNGKSGAEKEADSASAKAAPSTTTLQLLPPLSFTALSFSTGSSSKSSDPLPAQEPTPEPTPVPSPKSGPAVAPESVSATEPAQTAPTTVNELPSAAPGMVREPLKLPETAALAFNSGLSMVEVVSKLKLNPIRNIPTISPPPPGAPPPPPGAVAGHSNSPRVISPPSRPKIISPSNPRSLRPSKQIQPPPGLPPNVVPKPPQGPPPPASPVIGAALLRASGADVSSPSSQRSLGSQGQYVPATIYNPSTPKPRMAQDRPKAIGGADGSEAGSLLIASALTETARPMPARQIPMGFPVVTPLSPPHFNKRPTPSASENNSASSPPSYFSSSNGTASNGSPSSSNTTGPSTAGTAPSSNRRDFRPISFLTTQQQQSELHQQHHQQQQQQQQPENPSRNDSRIEQPRSPRAVVDNVYVPNPNNNIAPPNQLNMQRAQSPELRREIRNSRILGSPSLRPAGLPPVEKRVILTPQISAANPRPASPAFSTGFPIVESFPRTRDPSRIDHQLRLAEELNDPTYLDRDARPKLLPSKESSSSTTTGTTLSSSPSTPVSATSVEAKNRVQFGNFYMLDDPYKALKQDEPTDFFNAVRDSDLATVERMLKTFPALIHESNGFWPHPTPILVAARSKHAIETMRVLVRYGAALDRGDHNGTTVLHYVCEQYQQPFEAIQFLVKAGADCNSRDAKKRTPLMVLIQNLRISSTKVLIDSMRCLFKAGAQTRVADHLNLHTPLHYAILYCKEPAPVMELLLKKGAEVNARDRNKSTSLHLVLEKMDNQEVVQMMLLYGADPGLRNNNKRNALAVAAENLRVLSAWFLLENDLLSSHPDSLKKAAELCSKADGPDKSAKPLLKNTLMDWQGRDGRLKRIQLAQDCVFKVQRTPDMKTVDQTQVALDFLHECGQPVHQQLHQMNNYGSNSNPNHTSSNNSR